MGVHATSCSNRLSSFEPAFWHCTPDPGTASASGPSLFLSHPILQSERWVGPLSLASCTFLPCTCLLVYRRTSRHLAVPPRRRQPQSWLDATILCVCDTVCVCVMLCDALCTAPRPRRIAL